MCVVKKGDQRLPYDFTCYSFGLIFIHLNTNHNECVDYITKCLSVCNIRYVYYLVYVNGIFLLHMYINLTLTPLGR